MLFLPVCINDRACNWTTTKHENIEFIFFYMDGAISEVISEVIPDTDPTNLLDVVSGVTNE